MSGDGKNEESFWDLGTPKEKVYRKPDFSGHTVAPSDVEDDGEVPAGEKIPPRENGSSGHVIRTVNGPRNVSGEQKPRPAFIRQTIQPRPVYIRQTIQAQLSEPEQDEQDDSDRFNGKYSPENSILIKSVEIKSWAREYGYFNRFTTDARLSHKTACDTPTGTTLPAVPFDSYVPQYAHMSSAQLKFYRWVRECIRQGKYPDCPPPYIYLYIYEIINLPPEDIAPADGCQILARLWLNYRERMPKLDICMSDWMVDYCLLNKLQCPAELAPILVSVVPKAQFKEFFLDRQDSDSSLASAIIETLSDYDYRTSKYYAENSGLFDRIPDAMHALLDYQKSDRRGLFENNHSYKTTRDTYIGAIASSSVKRRIDIEFTSFIRDMNSRTAITAAVKYCENKMREKAGIKAKLNAKNIAKPDADFLDSYFGVTSAKNRIRDDTPEYMKNYESDTHGIDIDSARNIEAASWVNTARLTGDDYAEGSDNAEISAPDKTVSAAEEKGIIISAPGTSSEEMKPEKEGILQNNSVTRDSPDLRPAVRAALGGEFRKYARSAGMYEGELADRINSVFIDEVEEVGDIVLIDNGHGYEVVEDYREDVIKWLG